MADIVFVHGAWHGAWCWDQVAASLEERGHRAHTVTLPNHDQPGRTKRIWNTIGQYVREVESVVDSLATRPVLVGHSMGGYTVQRYLERHEAQRGILVASVPNRGVLGANLRVLRHHPVTALRSIVLAEPYALVSTPERTRALFFTDQTPQEIVDATHERLQAESSIALNTMLVRWPRTKRVSTPITVIGARGDAVFSVGEQHALASAYAGNPVMLDGGHDMMLDTHWPELVDAIDAAI